MASDTPEIGDYIGEFRREAMNVADHASEAAEHYANGKPESAALVIALSHYKISALDDERRNLLKLIQERHGVTPDDALKRGDN